MADKMQVRLERQQAYNEAAGIDGGGDSDSDVTKPGRLFMYTTTTLV